MLAKVGSGYKEVSLLERIVENGHTFYGGEKLSSWCSTIPGGSLVEAGVYGRIGIPGRFEHQLVPFYQRHRVA